MSALSKVTRKRCGIILCLKTVLLFSLKWPLNVKNHIIQRGGMGSQLLNGCKGGNGVNKSFKPGIQYVRGSYNPFDEFTACRKKSLTESSTQPPSWNPAVLRVKHCSDISPPAISGSCTVCTEKGDSSTESRAPDKDYFPTVLREVEGLSQEISVLQEGSVSIQKSIKSANETSNFRLQELAALAHQAQQGAQALEGLIQRQQSDLQQLHGFSSDQAVEIERLRTDLDDIKRDRDRMAREAKQRVVNGIIGEFVATFLRLVRAQSGVREGKEVPYNTEKGICENWRVDYEWVRTKRYWVYAYSSSSGCDVSAADAKERKGQVISEVNSCYSPESDMVHNLSNVIDAIAKHGSLLNQQPKKGSFLSHLFRF